MNAQIFVGLRLNKRKQFLENQAMKVPEDKIEAVKQIVAKAFEINVSDLMRNTRKEPIPIARMAAMQLIRENTYLKIVKIAEAFNRHHGMVIYATEQIEILNNTDKFFAKKYLEMTKTLNAKK